VCVLFLFISCDCKKKKKKKTSTIPKSIVKRGHQDGYCKVCLHIVSEAKKFLDGVAHKPPIDMGGGRIGTDGKKIHKYVEYNRSEAVVDEAFEDLCDRSEFQGFTESTDGEHRFRLMVGKTITMKSLSGESLKTGEGSKLKEMCLTLLGRHEDQFTEVFRNADEDGINSACQKALRWKKCPHSNEMEHDQIYASYTISTVKDEL